MSLPKYPISNVVAKVGVNFVRTVVETSNSIFSEIPQQNDIGIDGIIEIIQAEHPTGHCIAVQIKSGNSFFTPEKNECHFPVDNHAAYWAKYPLPVFGIVYVPKKSCSYWVNIKKYLEENQETNQIRYLCTKTNIFNLENFNKVFVPYLIGNLPEFNFDEALELFYSPNEDENYVGLIILFRKYSDRNVVWDEFIEYFRESEISKIPNIFIYFLAHIPWHMDIFGGRDKITHESRDYGKSLINTFGKDEVVKLLQFIDENGIDRGAIGQSVEAIISSIPERQAILDEISKDDEIPISLREWVDVIRMYRPSRY
ncbi:MAG: DUF4365 domain-containing protein [Anaerolineae bacterium]|nr:DUF4365 domain-containing protein [Anaerolineae bacterium]